MKGSLPVYKQHELKYRVHFIRYEQLHLVNDDKLWKFYHCSPKKPQKRSRSRACRDSLSWLYTFQQDNALSHRDREMVEFLARETPDFISSYLPSCLADTMNSFSWVNQIKFIV